MKTHSYDPQTAQQRRARAVFRTMKTRRSSAATPIAVELGLLGLFVLALAGVVGLRAWLAV